jgi:hypothetical protein
VIGMAVRVDDHYTVAGWLVADGGHHPRPVTLPRLDDATVAALRPSLLLGGQPGSGKSACLNALTVSGALRPDGDPATVLVYDAKAEGGSSC